MNKRLLFGVVLTTLILGAGVYYLRDKLFFRSGLSAQTDTARPVASKDQIIGAWVTSRDGNDIVETNLFADGTYRNYEHSRPMDSGKWFFEGGILKFQSELLDLPEATFINLKIDGNKLYLLDSDKQNEIWEKYQSK